jgi:hypothetical protein
MGTQENRALETGLNLDQVDWDAFIKRWLLYAHRYIPSHACVDGLSAEDVVFQAIDAVLTGRRVYTRPNIFVDSSEPDHQAPFFVYVCSVIRTISRSCYQRDNRYTAIHNLNPSTESGMDCDELLRNSCELTEALEQQQQLGLFKDHLLRTTDDPILLKIADSLLCSSYGALSAEQKALELQVDIGTFNNALKRFKRILKKFIEQRSKEESVSHSGAGRI